MPQLFILIGFAAWVSAVEDADDLKQKLSKYWQSSHRFRFRLLYVFCTALLCLSGLGFLIVAFTNWLMLTSALVGAISIIGLFWYEQYRRANN